MTIQELICELEKYDKDIVVHIGQPDGVLILNVEHICLDQLVTNDGNVSILVIEDDL